MMINKRLVAVWFVLGIISSSSLRAQLQIPLMSSKPSTISTSLSNSLQVKKIDGASYSYISNINAAKTASNVRSKGPHIKKTFSQNNMRSIQRKSNAYSKHNNTVKRKKRGYIRARGSGQWKSHTSWPTGVRKQHVQMSRKKRRRSAHRSEQVSVIRRSRPVRSQLCEPDIQPTIKKEPIRLVKPGSRVKPTQAHISWKRTQQEGLFYWPVEPKNFYISSQFGPRRKANGRPGFHAGLDMAAMTGTAVRAAAGGTVVEAHYSRGYGNYILIAHPRQFKTRYAHLDKILVKVGQKVKAGEHIGKVGATGYVRKSRWGGSGSHLHFEVYKASKPVNPYLFLA